jgi:RNA-splicing ligase RtcB
MGCYSYVAKGREDGHKVMIMCRLEHMIWAEVSRLAALEQVSAAEMIRRLIREGLVATEELVL